MAATRQRICTSTCRSFFQRGTLQMGHSDLVIPGPSSVLQTHFLHVTSLRVLSFGMIVAIGDGFSDGLWPFPWEHDLSVMLPSEKPSQD
jgi:hypothetical protein